MLGWDLFKNKRQRRERERETLMLYYIFLNLNKDLLSFLTACYLNLFGERSKQIFLTFYMLVENHPIYLY